MNTIRKSPILPIFVTVFIDLVGVGIVIPVLAPLFLSPTSPLAHPGWTFGEQALLIGLLAACYPFAQFFGAPYLGALSDRIGRKPVLLLSLAGTLVGYVFFALAIKWGAVWLLFLSRTLDGFTGGNTSTAQSAAADVSTKENKTRNFGMLDMAYGLGFILGPYIGGKLANPDVVSWFNPATPFWFAAALCFLNIILVAVRFEETLKQTMPRPMTLLAGFYNLRAALKLENLRTIFIVVFLFMFGFNFYAQFFQVLLIQKFGYTETSIGEMFAYVGLWLAFTQGIANRFISRRWKPHQVLPFTLMLLALTLISLMLPREAWVLYLIAPAMAFALGLSQPNSTTIISNLADEHSQGEILGINQSISALAMAIPPIIAGVLVGRSIYLPIVFSALFVLVSWGVFVFVFLRQRQLKFHEM